MLKCRSTHALRMSTSIHGATRMVSAIACVRPAMSHRSLACRAHPLARHPTHRAPALSLVRHRPGGQHKWYRVPMSHRHNHVQRSMRQRGVMRGAHTPANPACVEISLDALAHRFEGTFAQPRMRPRRVTSVSRPFREISRSTPGTRELQPPLSPPPALVAQAHPTLPTHTRPLRAPPPRGRPRPSVPSQLPRNTSASRSAHLLSSPAHQLNPPRVRLHRQRRPIDPAADDGRLACAAALPFERARRRWQRPVASRHPPAAPSPRTSFGALRSRRRCPFFCR